MNAHFTVMSTKGQIVLPVELRRELGIEPGTRMALLRDGDRIILRPVNSKSVDALAGKYAGGDVSMSDELIEDRRREREAEDRE